MKRAFFHLFTAVSLTLLALAAPGCGDDDDAAPPQLSTKGESCTNRTECAAGLACINQICSTGTYSVEESAKECVIVECSAAADCCPTWNPPPDCETWKSECDADPMSFYCDQYTQNCVKPTNYCSGYNCEDSKCTYKQPCTMNNECLSNACSGGFCVECTSDAQCDTNSVCVSSKCQNKCNVDSDCNEFSRCNATTHICEEGKCKTDRECIAATRNANATCEDGECIEPCTTSLECGSPDNWDFYSCVSGQCKYVGCESDKECQYQLGGLPGGVDTDIKCMEKKSK